MKKLITTLLLALCFIGAQAQNHTPKLKETDRSLPNPMTLCVGYSDEFVYKIWNEGDSLSRINNIVVIINPDADILLGDSLYLTITVDSVTGNYFPGCSSYGTPQHNRYKIASDSNVIDSTMLKKATGRYYLRQNDSIILHIPFKVITCNNSGGTTEFHTDSSNRVIDKNIESAHVSINYGGPALTIAPNIFDSASYCVYRHKKTANVGFLVANNDLNNINPPPYADSIRLYFFCTPGVCVMDSSTFKINGFSIPLTDIHTYFSSDGYHAYLVDLPNYTASGCFPFGRNTLCSITGLGRIDELDKDSSFEVTATIIYDTNCLPFVQLGSTDFQMPKAGVTWNDQCHSLPYYHNKLIPADSIVGNTISSGTLLEYKTTAEMSTMTAPSDVTVSSPDFNVNICPEYFQQWFPVGFHFDCPDEDYELILPMTAGYHLDTNNMKLIIDTAEKNAIHSSIYYDTSQFIAKPFITCTGAIITLPHPTIQEFYIPSDYIVMNFGRLPLCNCSASTAADVLNCFTVPLALDCSSLLHYSEDPLSYSFQFVCDSAECANCGDTLAAANTVTYHHCFGGCGSVVPETDSGFTFMRTDKGWRNLNFAADSFYSPCNPGMTLSPANKVEDTTVINLHAAYPGDQVEAKVTGSYDGYICKDDTNMFLQIRFQPLVTNTIKPYFAFVLDSTINSTFVITGSPIPSLNDLPLVCPLHTDTVFRLGDWEVMNFSLTRAIQNSAHAQWLSLLGHTLPDTLIVAADIHLRVTAGKTVEPFAPGENIMHLRTEFMDLQNNGDTNPSCDTWGSDFSIYQPQTSIGFSTTDYTVEGCDTFKTAIRFKCIGAANNYFTDDYVHEFRPYSTLNDSLKAIIPPGYIYLGANYQTEIDNYDSTGANNYFLGGQSTKYFAVTPVSESNPLHVVSRPDTILFIGLNHSCWPIMDEKLDGTAGTRAFLNLLTQPICSLSGTSVFYYTAGYRVNTQQFDSAFQYDTVVTGALHIIHQNPIVNIKDPTSLTDLTDTLVFTFTLCDSISPATMAWASIENIGLDSLWLNTATLYNATTHTYCDSVFYDGGKGILFKVGRLSYCDNFVLKAILDSNSNSCPLPTGIGQGTLLLHYGNVCGDTISTPYLVCENRVDTFTYTVSKTTLEVFNNSHFYDTVSLCSQKEIADSLLIESASIGTVMNPVFWVQSEPGLTIDSVQFTYPCGGSTDTIIKYHHFSVSSGGLVLFDTLINGVSGVTGGWILNKDLGINGLPGADNTLCAVVYFKLNCQFNTNDSLQFSVTGRSTCDILIGDTVKNLPPIDNSCCIPLACLDPKGYDLVWKNTNAKSLAPYFFIGQKILIEGTLKVDTTLYIEGCNVAMAPGALIEVVDSSELQIIEGSDSLMPCSHVHAACDTMWRGIHVHPGSTFYTIDETLIEDADTAVYVINDKVNGQGLYDLNVSTFNKNYVDIAISPYAENYHGRANNCLFTCRNFDSIISNSHCVILGPYPYDNWRLASPAILLYPFTGQKTHIGWYVDTIGYFSDTLSTISVMKGNNTFDNLGNGIYALSSNMLIYTDKFEYINNNASSVAIYSQGDMSSYDYSLIVGGPNLFNANKFFDCNYGVFANIGFSNVNISYNKMYLDTLSKSGVSYGIAVAGPMPYYPLVNIDSNIIDSATIGIIGAFNQTAAIHIKNNAITGNPCTGATGIEMLEWASPYATYILDSNTIQNVNSGIIGNSVRSMQINSNNIKLNDTGCYSKQGMGIGLFGDVADHIYGNTISLNNHASPSDYSGDNFYGIYSEQCTKNLITCNYTNYLTNHLYFYQDQFFNVWNNTMTAGNDTGVGMVFTNHTALGTQTHSGLSTDNQWNEAFHCKSYFDTSTGAYPSVSIFWVQAGSSYCPDSGSCGPQIDTLIKLSPNSSCDPMFSMEMDISLLDTIARNRMSYNINKDTAIEISKGLLTSTIWSKKSLLNNPILHHFNDSLSTTPLGQYMIVDSSLNSVLPSTLLTNMNAINPTNNIESNLQTTAQIYLRARRDKRRKLSSTDSNTICMLSNKCPKYDGAGVYQARTLRAYYNFEFGPYQFGGCNSNRDDAHRPKKNTQDTTKNISFNIFPNPNKGNYTIEYNLNGENGVLDIYNQLGLKAAEYLLPYSSSKIFISNTDLSQGLYFYKLFTNKETKKVGKMVIIK